MLVVVDGSKLSSTPFMHLGLSLPLCFLPPFAPVIVLDGVLVAGLAMDELVMFVRSSEGKCGFMQGKIASAGKRKWVGCLILSLWIPFLPCFYSFSYHALISLGLFLPYASFDLLCSSFSLLFLVNATGQSFV